MGLSTVSVPLQAERGNDIEFEPCEGDWGDFLFEVGIGILLMEGAIDPFIGPQSWWSVQLLELDENEGEAPEPMSSESVIYASRAAGS